jgi:hypothetical protein
MGGVPKRDDGIVWSATNNKVAVNTTPEADVIRSLEIG